MFEIKLGDRGEIVATGRLDASRVDQAKTILDAVDSSKTVDLTGLDYISSVGIGVLVATQKRLGEPGHRLELVNVNDRIKEILRYSGLDGIFGIK